MVNKGREIQTAKGYGKGRGILSIDPGASGALAVIDFDEGRLADVKPMPRLVLALHHLLKAVDRQFGEYAIVVEQVGPYQRKNKGKKQFAGIKSNFQFGYSVGILHAILEITFGRGAWTVVPSSVWMKELGCLTRGHKEVTRNFAQGLWPEANGKITKRNADAICLGAYAFASLTNNGWTPCE